MRSPRLRFIDGLWMCGSHPFIAPYTLGIGYTKPAAYDDWKQKTEAAADSAAQS